MSSKELDSQGKKKKPSRKAVSTKKVARSRSPINVASLLPRRQPTIMNEQAEMSASFTQPIPDLKDWSVYEKRILAQIRTEEWVNIPAAIVDGFNILTTHQDSVLEQLVTLCTALKSLENRFTRKEKKSNDNMSEVLSYLIEMNSVSIEKLDSNMFEIEKQLEKDLETSKNQVTSTLDLYQSRIDKIDDTLRRKYWTHEDVEEFLTDAMRKESKTTTTRIDRLQETTQGQLDELFFNHVAVPGLINPSEAAFTRLESGTPSPLSRTKKKVDPNKSEDSLSNEIGESEELRINSPRANKAFEKQLSIVKPQEKDKVEKLLYKFKGRNGKYASLPLWTTAFEEEMHVGLEDLQLAMRAQGYKLVEEIDTKLLKQMSTLEAKLGEGQNKFNESLLERLAQLTVKINDRIQVIELKQTDDDGLYQMLIENLRKEIEVLKNELASTLKQFESKAEKIQWFETKLKKWIKLFEDSEEDSANRHNSVVSKITEVEAALRKQFATLSASNSKLEKKVEKISKGEIAIQSKGGKSKNEKRGKRRVGKKDQDSDDDANSDGNSASQLSAQTKNRLTKATAKTRSKVNRLSNVEKTGPGPGSSPRRSTTVPPKPNDKPNRFQRRTSILNDADHIDYFKMPHDAQMPPTNLKSPLAADLEEKVGTGNQRFQSTIDYNGRLQEFNGFQQAINQKQEEKKQKKQEELAKTSNEVTQQIKSIMKLSDADPSMIDQSPQQVAEAVTLDNSIDSFLNEESKLQEGSIQVASIEEYGQKTTSDGDPLYDEKALPNSQTVFSPSQNSRSLGKTRAASIAGGRPSVTFAAEAATRESSNHPQTKDSRRHSTFIREGHTQSTDLDLYGTLKSLPQTSIVTEEENREDELRNNSRTNSIGHLFNNAKLSNPKTLPPIGLVSPTSKELQFHQQMGKTHNGRFNVNSGDAYSNESQMMNSPGMVAASAITDGLSVNMGRIGPPQIKGNIQIRSPQPEHTRATTQVKAQRSKLVPLEVKFQNFK